MMKYKYLFKQDDKLRERVFTIEEIENGAVMDFPCLTWGIVARRRWTGLTDKNGVEIYEGDILQTEYYGIKKVPDSLQECCIFGLFSTNGKLEVIGNIYEKPELLEQK